MQKHEIDELLKRHCHISSLDLCTTHWIPEGKSLDWYLGFLQCLEVHKGIRELFAEKNQPEAYEILGTRIRDELAKFLTNGSAQEGVARAILLVMIQKGVTISFLVKALASVCEERRQTEVVALLESAASLLEQDEV